MSLAVLRKKTLNSNSRIAPISGNGGFSLNGKHRQHTYIGQQNLGLSSSSSTFSSNVVNKSVLSTKYLFYARCNRGRICSQPIYNDIRNNNNKTAEEYIDNLNEKCYKLPDTVGANKSSYNCFTKDLSVKVNNNKGYSNFIKIKTLQCSIVKTGPKFNLGTLPYTDYLMAVKSERNNCK